MADKEKDLKEGSVDPSGNGQPEKTVVESEDDVEEDLVDTDEQDQKSETESETTETDDKITISKAEFAKLQEERDNYKKGLLLAKNKGRKLPEIGKTSDKDSEKEFDWEQNYNNSEFVTKKDFQKKEEKAAINIAVETIPELDTN
jgi:hypothetical protein